MRRPLAASFAVIAGTLAPPAAASAQEAAPAPEVVLEGKGWGHGVGLPQDGAHVMGLAGAAAGDILAHFYPGTSIGRRGGTVRVDLLDSPRASAVLSFPSGGDVQPAGGDHAGFPVTVAPGGRVRVTFDGGRYHAFPLEGATAVPVSPGDAATPTAAQPDPAPDSTTTTTIPTLLGLIPLPPAPAPQPAPATTAAPPPAQPATTASEPTSGSPLVAMPAGGGTVGVDDLGRTYRGTITARAAPGGLQLVNELDVEQYIRGMGEVLDPTWPAAALQVQAIVARTYALDAMAAGRALCSSQQCQVYLGTAVEYGAMNRAVADTAGQVLTYQGRLAEAVYSANAGGITATPEEGFGLTGADYPYLTPVTYPSADPQVWELRMTLTELAARFGYPGQPTTARVSRVGPSGRALEVTIDGDTGPLTVDGPRFFDTLSLRSNLFTIRVEGGASADATAAELTAAPGGRALRRPALVLEAGPAGVTSRGRTPWAAFALLLLAAWATAASATRRASATPATAPAGEPAPETAPRPVAAPRGTRRSARTGRSPSLRRQGRRRTSEGDSAAEV